VSHVPSFRLLAGPFLRRAEPRQVCIWIATDAPLHAQAEVFRLSVPYQPEEPLEILGESGEGSGGARTVHLGERLYVTLIRAHPRGQAFPKDQLLAYDLILNGQRLADLGLLSGSQGIAYPGLPLPSFFLASQTTSLLHGSCRNLGGSGLDALPCGDELIGLHPQDLDLRPSVLVLDGDQIYADHLPSPLIRHLTRLGNELMGWEEAIPGVQGRLAELPVDGRGELATQGAGFTSGGAQNQLMAFGEYAALYLVAWNEANWPESFPPFPAEPSPEDASAIEQAAHVAKQVLGAVEKTPEKAYQEMVENLESVRQRIPAVRRLLANIPTYMIFDDHDTTDDLFLTRKWKEGVWASPMGRRIVANALAAAWAFQCWGSDPDLYSDSFVDAITSHFQQRAADGAAAQAYEQTVWHFPDWCFHIPGWPATIVMDTRTQRGYDSEEGAARLVGEEGLRTIARAAARAGYQRGEPLILVSPTPVVGYETVEGMQERVSRYIGPYRFDLESWHANLDGYVSFFQFLISELDPSNVVILAGDVHYGFTISATFTWQGKTLPIVQLTSSALKNTGLALKIVELVSLYAGRTDRHFGWDSLAEDVKEAEGALGSEGTDATVSQQASDTVSAVRGRSVYVVRGKPALMPANLAADAALEEADPAQGEGVPDWQDARTFEPTWGYRSEPIVGENNLGLVRFRSGNLLVHRLLIPTEEGTRASTAIVRTLPGRVVLVPVPEEGSADREMS
jgi:hypothetical protein